MAALISIFLAASFSWIATPALADETALVPGLITATNVDITADTGEVLDQRLTTGDQVWIVRKPKQKRQGWVRISRSPTDEEGIGWVESKYVHAFERWEGAREEPASATVAHPPSSVPAAEKDISPMNLESPQYGTVGVLPFVAPEADDPVAKRTYEAFSLSLRKSGRMQVSGDSLQNEHFSLEKPDSIQKVMKARKLGGVFVGNLSGEMGPSRLLQIKFYKKGRNQPVLEKVKKIPKEGNLKEIIDGLVTACVSSLFTR